MKIGRAFTAFLFMAFAAIAPAEAGDKRQILEKFEGTWKGSGRMQLPPPNNFRFTCRIKGTPDEKGNTVDLDGHCWRGIFSTPLQAKLKVKKGRIVGIVTDTTKQVKIAVNGKSRGDTLSLGLSQGKAEGHLSGKFISETELGLVVSIVSAKTKRKHPVISLQLDRRRKTAALR